MAKRVHEQHQKPARAIVSYVGGANRVYESGLFDVDFSGIVANPPQLAVLRVHDGNTVGGLGCVPLFPKGTDLNALLNVINNPPPLRPESFPFINVTSFPIPHNRGYFPIMQVYSPNTDTGLMELIDAELIQVDANNGLVNFSQPTTGFVVVS